MLIAKRATLAVTSIAILLSNCSRPIDPVLPPKQASDYAVYDAVLKVMFFDPDWRVRFGMIRPSVVAQFVVFGRTSLGYLAVLAVTRTDTDQVLKTLAPLPDGLYDQLFRDNESSTNLENRFMLQVPVTFLDDATIQALDSEFVLHGWGSFWQQYRMAQGILVLSR